MIIDGKLISQVYGGWIGKIIGVLHGANTEGWTHEKIMETFEEISFYPFKFKNFAADDDINGPAFFQRALDNTNELTVKNCKENFLNYVSDGHGFFWWGGYGISTENTAYSNLINGTLDTNSGSASLNGHVMANQIGGQIFSDCWGFINPGNCSKAANMAELMSSVTHDEEGLMGARFIASAIAAAFNAKNVDEIYKKALEQINQDCEYATMARDVYNYCKNISSSWKDSFYYVKEKYGYQHYQGVCHIIPNSAVIILSLIHGKGDFSKTINIANMCGWDTDCNVGNLGAILGVFNGIENIDDKWLPQINDFVCLSSSIGYLNIQTISDLALESIKFISKLYNISVPSEFDKFLNYNEGQYFHFTFPKSTHSIRTSSDDNLPICIKNITKYKDSEICQRGLQITAPSIGNSDSFKFYYQSYYVPSDFDDNRYLPDLSAKIYPGDSIEIKFHSNCDKTLSFTPYYIDRISKTKTLLIKDKIITNQKDYYSLNFTIPPQSNSIIYEVGCCVNAIDICKRETKTSLSIILTDFIIKDCPNYKIDTAILPMEVWTAVDYNIAGFSYLRGAFELFNKKMSYSSADKCTELYTGNINWKNYEFTAEFIPNLGNEHSFLFRTQGTLRGYLASIRNNYFSIEKKIDKEIITLCRTEIDWNLGEKMTVVIKIMDSRIDAEIINKGKLSTLDSLYKKGCIGFSNNNFSNTSIINYSIRGE